MYKRFQTIDEREKRIYMAGLTFSQVLGYKSAREYCRNTVLAIFDVDTDEMVFFSNSIDRDIEHTERDNTEFFSKYIKKSIATYVKPEFQEAAYGFFDLGYLRRSFERGLMCESIEYECDVAGETVWIRACYELEQNEANGHVMGTAVLIDVSRLRGQDA